MTTRQVPFRWDDEFIASIDAARGDVSRAKFVQRCVERALMSEGERRIPAPEPVKAGGVGSTPPRQTKPPSVGEERAARFRAIEEKRQARRAAERELRKR